MTQATANKPAKPLAQIALDSAVDAVRKNESAAYTATVALALLMANRQVERAESDKDISAKKNKEAFRAFCKVFAARGNMVWVGTEHLVSLIMAKRGKERESLASDYVDGGKHAKSDAKKPEGAVYVEGLKQLRTWSFRLAADVCDNHADVIRDLLVTKQAGASGEALQQKFQDFCKRQYGATYAALCAKLAPEKKEQNRDAVESVIKAADKLTDKELQVVVARLQGLWLERQATLAEAQEMFGSPAEAPVGQSDAQAVEAEADRRAEAEAKAA